MIELIEAIHATLKDDATLVGYLATLHDGNPAIVLAEPYPEILPLPFLAIGGVIAHLPFDTKTTQGDEIQLDLRVFSQADGDIGRIEAIAACARALLHGARLTVGSGTTLVAIASGPLWIPSEGDNLYGRSVPLRFIIT